MAMMISKFNKLIHNKTVWLVFAIFISIAFVGVYTGSQAGSPGKQANPADEVVGRLYGEDVTRQEFGRAYQNVYVMYSMMMGQALNIDDEIDQVVREAAWQRLATLKKADQLKLTVTPEQVINLIKRQQVFQNQQTGQYDANAYNAFVNGFLPRAGMNAKAFENMMAENVLIEKASSAAAQGALVTEEEILKTFHLYNDMLTVSYAPIPRSLAGTPEITEADAKAYYERNPDQFVMPEKVIVNYVQFPVSDYTNSVTVTDEMVAQVYENNKQQFIKPMAPDAPVGAPPEYKTLDEVKPEIISEITMQLARQQAFNAADVLVASLAEEGTTFERETEKAGLKVISNTPAFSATDQVKGVDPTAPFATAAFNLEKDETHYYSDPVVGRDTVYVIALHKKLKAFPLSFELAEADATESARIEAAEKAYVEKAEAVHAEVEAALASGTSFADALSKYNIEAQQTAPFNASTQLDDAYGREIMSATIPFEQGTLANLINTPDEFLIAYVATREKADEETTLPAMRDQLANAIRNQKAGQLAQAWRESLLEEANFVDLSKSADSDES